MYIVSYFVEQDDLLEAYGPFKTYEEAKAWMIDDVGCAENYLKKIKVTFELCKRKDNKIVIPGYYVWEIVEIQTPQH